MLLSRLALIMQMIPDVQGDSRVAPSVRSGAWLTATDGMSYLLFEPK